MDKRGFLIIVIAIVAGLVVIMLAARTMMKGAQQAGAENKTAGECASDSDCVPATCCHPKTCVSRANKPKCEGMFCTQVCEPGTLDCGQGRCACAENRCKVVFVGQ